MKRSPDFYLNRLPERGEFEEEVYAENIDGVSVTVILRQEDYIGEDEDPETASGGFYRTVNYTFEGFGEKRQVMYYLPDGIFGTTMSLIERYKLDSFAIKYLKENEGVDIPFKRGKEMIWQGKPVSEMKKY